MKRFYVKAAGLALVLAALASCQARFNEVPVPEDGTVTETLELSFEDGSPDTKVGIASLTGKFSWTEGDQIAVWYQNGSSGSWSTGPVSATSRITISGAGTRAKLAVYPASARTSFNMAQQESGTDGTFTKITYPTEIDLSGKDAGYSPMPMIALNDPSRSGLKFYHAGGLVRFKLYGIPAGTMYIKIANTTTDQPLAGDFPVKIPSGNELSAAGLVYTRSQWAYLYDDSSWDSLFGPSHTKEVLVKITASAYTQETDGVTINLPVPLGVYDKLTVTALNAGKQAISQVGSVSYVAAEPDLLWDCERATGRHLSAQALKPNHPMTLPTAIHGIFSVSDTKKVYFASGNVLFIADKSGNNWTNRRWKFADNQWDVYADESNYQDGSNRVIDLFGWGTGNNPWLTSIDRTDYTTFTDWGVHFDEVGNGSDSTTDGTTWHTLTREEWDYLHSGRPGADILWSFCTIADNAGVTHSGLMYLPNDWVSPAGISFRPRVMNVYSIDGSYDGYWTVMEENGALFLPSGGFRELEGFAYINKLGVYWSSTSDGEYASNLYFENIAADYISPGGSSDVSHGYSVRLVRE